MLCSGFSQPVDIITSRTPKPAFNSDLEHLNRGAIFRHTWGKMHPLYAMKCGTLLTCIFIYTKHTLTEQVYMMGKVHYRLRSNCMSGDGSVEWLIQYDLVQCVLV